MAWGARNSLAMVVVACMSVGEGKADATCSIEENCVQMVLGLM